MAEHSVEMENDSFSKQTEEPQEYPILYVDINLGKDRIERLTVYEGEDPKEVALDTKIFKFILFYLGITYICRTYKDN